MGELSAREACSATRRRISFRLISATQRLRVQNNSLSVADPRRKRSAGFQPATVLMRAEACVVETPCRLEAGAPLLLLSLQPVPK